MKQKVWQEVNLEQLPEVAKEVAGLLNSAPTVWRFYGLMGAGKTTFIKHLCSALGVQDSVQSPTFSLVNEYQTLEGETIYHFDFYRLDSPDEAHQIGVAEYLDSGFICLIEWPEKIQPLLPEESVHILLQQQPDNSRTIEVKIHGTTD